MGRKSYHFLAASKKKMKVLLINKKKSLQKQFWFSGENNVEINLYKDGILHASIYKTMN